MDLSTTYLGLQLPHPLIPGASPLAEDLDRVRRLEDAGVAASAQDSAPIWDETFHTDSNGVVEIPVDREGIWNVRALHIVPARPGSGADWDVHWVTFVFSRDGDD
jgi:hypothetical protein